MTKEKAKDESDDWVRKQPLHIVGLSQRLMNGLAQLGVATVGQFLDLPDGTLRDCRNIGKTSIIEAREAKERILAELYGVHADLIAEVKKMRAEQTQMLEGLRDVVAVLQSHKTDIQAQAANLKAIIAGIEDTRGKA